MEKRGSQGQQIPNFVGQFKTSESGHPHEQPTPCQAKLSHLERALVFLSYLCNPCAILCPEECTRKLIFFAASSNAKQPGRGVACGLGCRVQAGWDGGQRTILRTHIQKGYSLSSKIKDLPLYIRYSFGQGKQGAPESLQGEVGKILPKSAQPKAWIFYQK